MLQRAKTPKATPARQALKLLELRDQLRNELGEVIYLQKTKPFQPYVASAMQTFGCPIRAAAHVVNLLDASQHTDITAKKLITCAAVDLALAS